MIRITGFSEIESCVIISCAVLQRMVDCQVQSKKSFFLLKTFKRPDRIISCNCVISDIEHGLSCDIWAEKNVIFVLKIVINVIRTVRINYFIDCVKSKIEAVVITNKKSIYLCWSCTRTWRFSCIITGVNFQTKLLRFVWGILAIYVVAGTYRRA